MASISSSVLPKVKSSRMWFCDAWYGVICAKALFADAFSNSATAGAVTATWAAFVTTARRDGEVSSALPVFVSSAMIRSSPLGRSRHSPSDESFGLRLCPLLSQQAAGQLAKIELYQ